MLHTASCQGSTPRMGSFPGKAGRRAWARKGKEPRRLPGLVLRRAHWEPSLPLSSTFSSAS